MKMSPAFVALVEEFLGEEAEGRGGAHGPGVG